MLSFEEQSWLFLREFTKEVLQNINSNLFRKEIRSEIRSKLIDVIKNKDYILHEVDSQINPADLPVVKFIAHPADMPKLAPAVSTSKQEFVSSKVVEEPGPNLGRISSILVDDVYAIECQGPGKMLIVKRPKKEEISSVSLSEDEIKRIIADFADIAKSYPTEGVFNAAYKNYSITAIISDFAGSRFIITKYLDVKKLVSVS